MPRYRELDVEIHGLLYGCLGGEMAVTEIVPDIENGVWPRAFLAAYPELEEEEAEDEFDFTELPEAADG